MQRCPICGNGIDRPIEIDQGCETIRFESFECAGHVKGPSCAECGWQIDGHGVSRDDAVYCCIHAPLAAL